MREAREVICNVGIILYNEFILLSILPGEKVEFRHPSIDPSILSSIHPSNPFILLITHSYSPWRRPQLPTRRKTTTHPLFTHSSSHLFILPPIPPSLHPSIHPSIPPSLHPSLHPSIPPSIPPSPIHPSIRPSVHPSTHIHTYIYTSIHPYKYVYARMHVCMHACIHTRISTYTNAYITYITYMLCV